MSLDVYLVADTPHKNEGSGIFIRENGRTRQIIREEWDVRNPGREPIIAIPSKESTTLYSANITHNLTGMAAEVKVTDPRTDRETTLYKALWHPEGIDIQIAYDLIPLLRDGLDMLRSRPEHFTQWNPSNGWGDYEGLVSFVQDYLAACNQYPDAKVEVSG